jgi:hypothetical protein
MAMGADLLFQLTVAALVTHELDAVRKAEWRILPVLRDLSDAVGQQTFIWLHVPLIGLILWIDAVDRTGMFRLSFAAFAVLHVWLHWLLRHHPAYAFTSLSSRALIALPGLLGLLYVLGRILP